MATYRGYARVSTEEQGKKTSIESQRKYLEKQASYHHLPFRFYYDEKSGKNFERQGFQLMLLEAEAGDIIACQYNDRLGRNSDETKKIAKQLFYEKKIKIEIGSVDVDFNDATSEFLFGIGTEVSEFYRKLQRQKSLNGIKDTKLSGNWEYRGDLYGYQYNASTKKYDIVKEEAEIIRYLFDEYYYKKRSIFDISNEFIEKGITTRKGKPFYAQSLRRLILKPIYMGYVVIEGAGKHKDIADVKFQKSNLVKSTKYPAIVPEGTFWGAYNNYRHLDRKHGRQYEYRHSFYKLTGLIRCKNCEELGKTVRLVHSYTKRENIDYPYYTSRIHEKGCKVGVYSFPASKLENIIQFCFYIFIENISEIKDYFLSIQSQNEKIHASLKESLLIIEEKLKVNESKQNRIAKRLIDIDDNDDLYDILMKQSKDITKESIELKKQLAKVKNNIELIGYDDIYDKIEDEIKTYKLMFEQATNDQIRDLYKKYIKEAYIKDSYFTIIFLNWKKITMELKPSKGRFHQTEYLMKVSLGDINQYKALFNTEKNMFSVEGYKSDKFGKAVVARVKANLAELIKKPD